MILSMLSISLGLVAQQNTMLQTHSEEPTYPDYVAIGAGVGFLSFFGDIDKMGRSQFTNIRGGYFFNLERRFGEVIGVSLESTIGKVAFNERSDAQVANRNFESPLFQIGVSIHGHFDNDYIINRDGPFSPYLGVGFSYVKFDPHGDLYAANDSMYHYWSDGSIRDVDENSPMAASSNILVRDYEYETQLTDSLTQYDRSTFAVPLTLGFKWKFFEHIQGRLWTTYNIAFSDWMDNYEANDNNDSYLFTGFSMYYLFKAKPPKPKDPYEDVDFVTMEAADADGDGVKDMEDFCPNTPAGIRTDKYGCALDSDEDGVPDHIDQEDNSAKGAHVDPLTGVTLTEEQMANIGTAVHDSLVTVRSQVFSDAPSSETLQQIDQEIIQHHDNSQAVPERFQPADFDGDGFISAKELEGAIDGFFEGTVDLSAKDIDDLIDYFFEQ